jgi:hypothetical protein
MRGCLLQTIDPSFDRDESFVRRAVITTTLASCWSVASIFATR